MRYETIYASQYLVWRLQYTHVVQHIRDDGDILSLDLRDGTHLQVVMWERGIDPNEVRYYYETNTKRGIYTLMLLWVDLFLPSDGTLYIPDEWMTMLTHLHGGKLYAYELAGRDAYFFPVYFEGQHRKKQIRYGNVVNYAHIGGQKINSTLPNFRGTWYVGSFDSYEGTSEDELFDHHRHGSPLAIYYEILGLEDGQPIDDVKQAYRQLAMRYHPDLNTVDDTHRAMAKINDAYQRIIQHLMVD